MLGAGEGVFGLSANGFEQRTARFVVKVFGRDGFGMGGQSGQHVGAQVVTLVVQIQKTKGH